VKKILKISAWSLFVIGALLLVGFVDSDYKAITCARPEINIDKSNGHGFVTEELVLEEMSNLGYSFSNQLMGDIEVDRIEKSLLNMPGVKNAEVFKFNSGVVKIDITQSTPIARVIMKGGLISFYLDETGEQMPLSEHYVAKVPIFNGEIKEGRNGYSVNELNENDSLKAVSVIDDIYEVALLFDENKFMSAQIVQTYFNQDKEMEMIPRVGNQRILFGDSKDAEIKFKKLTRFYTEVINPKELNLYDTLNIKYINQIICSKR
jgi:cell division protein FtsQ